MNRITRIVLSLALAIPLTLPAQMAQPPDPHDPTPDQYTERNSIPFAAPAGHPLLANLYLPHGQGPGPFPGVVFIHGGGWSGGSRLDTLYPARYLAAHGYVVFAIDYRLTPVGRYPDQIADCRTGIQFFLAHAAEYHLDPSRIALAGISAGAHLVSMLGLSYSEPAHPDPAIKAVVSISGVYNLNDPAQTSLLDNIARLFPHPCAEDPQPCRQASPIDNVHPGAPPYLIMHGEVDTAALPANARAFVEKLTAANVPAETFWAKGSGHPFWHSSPWVFPFEKTMTDFLDRHLKTTATSPAPPSPYR